MWFLTEQLVDGKPEFFEIRHNHLFPFQAKSQNAPWLEESSLAQNPPISPITQTHDLPATARLMFDLAR